MMGAGGLIMAHWEDEVASIIASKEGQALEEAKESLREVGRSAPCRYFFAMPPRCGLRRDLDCVACPDYKPHETPGRWSKGYAVFESGRVIHLVEDVESDGFYRSGRTLCGRMLSEEEMAVEIYPLESFDQLDEEIREMYPRQRICRKCQGVLLHNE
jgi:hypothetical protein